MYAGQKIVQRAVAIALRPVEQLVHRPVLGQRVGTQIVFPGDDRAARKGTPQPCLTLAQLVLRSFQFAPLAQFVDAAHDRGSQAREAVLEHEIVDAQLE